MRCGECVLKIVPERGEEKAAHFSECRLTTGEQIAFGDFRQEALRAILCIMRRKSLPARERINREPVKPAQFSQSTARAGAVAAGGGNESSSAWAEKPRRCDRLPSAPM